MADAQGVHPQDEVAAIHKADLPVPERQINEQGTNKAGQERPKRLPPPVGHGLPEAHLP